MSEVGGKEQALHRQMIEENVRKDSPLEKYLSTETTPQQLDKTWREEKPWESSSDKTKHARKRMQLPNILHRKRKIKDNADESGLVNVDKANNDVRVWLLTKLGIPEAELKKHTVDQYAAQELIAKGLKISQFEAALIDRSTRALPTEMLADSLGELLTDPAKFTNTKKELVDFAREIEDLDAKDWPEVVKDVKKMAPTSAPKGLEDLIRELDANSGQESVPMAGHMLSEDALHDVITTRVQRTFGKKIPDMNIHYTTQLLEMWGREISDGTRQDTPVHESVMKRLNREMGNTEGQRFLGGGPWTKPE